MDCRTVIRSASPEDAPRLLEIYTWYVLNTAITFEITVPTEEEFAARIRKISARYPYLVLEEEGRIAGYAYAGAFKEREAYDASCELSIYLEKDAQKKGYGRLLYGELERQLAGRGMTNLYACISWPDKEDEYLDRNSVQFHEHLGFRLVGKFRGCGRKFGRRYSMVWMEKIIDETGLSEEETSLPGADRN